MKKFKRKKYSQEELDRMLENVLEGAYRYCTYEKSPIEKMVEFLEKHSYEMFVKKEFNGIKLS